MFNHIFWDASSQRYRSLWRLIIQIILLLVILIPLINLAIIPGMIIYIRQGGTLASFAPDTLTAVSLANQTVQTFSSLAILTAVVLSVWLTGKFADKRPFAAFGFHLNRAWWLDFAFGLFLGAMLMILIFAVELAAGLIQIRDTFYTPATDSPFWLSIFSILVVYISVGIYEELLVRGYQLRNTAEGFAFLKPKAAVIISTLLTSLLFGLLHANNPNATAVSTFNLFIAGIFLAWGFLLTGELALPIGLHITWNFFQGNVFGFPVSGQGDAPTFIAVEQSGNVVITGGEFGPEAGLISLGAILLGSLLIAGWVRWRYGRVQPFSFLANPTLIDKKEDTIDAEIN